MCGGENQSTSTKEQHLTAVQSRVLGFESPETDWVTSTGSLSTESVSVSEGAGALAIVPAGYTVLSSIPMSGLEVVPDGHVSRRFSFLRPLLGVPWV